jgi:hypothetical protein
MAALPLAAMKWLSVNDIQQLHTTHKQRLHPFVAACSTSTYTSVFMPCFTMQHALQGNCLLLLLQVAG